MGHLFERYGPSQNVFSLLDGIFAGVIYDESNDEYFAFRDPIGIISFYWGRDLTGAIWFASEMKSLQQQCTNFDVFPPGYMYSSKTNELSRFFNPTWIDHSIVPTQRVDFGHVRKLVIQSVVKRLMTDVPLAVYLSGGLDSSLIASIATRHLKEAKNTFDRNSKLHTFSIGVRGSSDLISARKVAEFLGTIHHEFYFDLQHGIDSLRDLIYHLESYHPVRAALPNYLLARKVKAAGFKVVLSGEGADEVFGGYAYFQNAPTKQAFHKETIVKVLRMHYWDVLRANKASYTWGLEVRVPFLDLAFLDYIMNIDPIDKMQYLVDQTQNKGFSKIEKWILRKAFDVGEDPYLPKSVLFRKKERFSDGVGHQWVDQLRDHANRVITDEMWNQRAKIFPEDIPLTKEYFLLQSIFNEFFPNKEALNTVPKGLTLSKSSRDGLDFEPSWKSVHEFSKKALDFHSIKGGFFQEGPPNHVIVQSGLRLCRG